MIGKVEKKVETNKSKKLKNFLKEEKNLRT